MRKQAISRGSLSAITNGLINFLSSKTFLYATLVLFALQAIYFAITIRLGVPPDEGYHLAYIKIFSDNLPSPVLPSHHEYSILRESVHNPFFLYHYLLAFPYKLISGFSNAYIVLRLLNVALGICSLLLVVKIADFIKISALARNLSVFMLVNTLMFTFLSAAINYDNLFVLLSLASFLLLLKLTRKIDARTILLLAVTLLAGVLTKINFLPVAFIVFAIFVFHYLKNVKKPPAFLINSFHKTFSSAKKTNWALVVVLVFLSVLFVQRFVYNVVEYRSLAPSCSRLISIQECRQDPLFARNEYIHENKRKTDKNPLEYVRGWVPLIENRTFGIFAHKELGANKVVKFWSALILLAGAILLVAQWKKVNRETRFLLYMASFYAAAVLYENMQSYYAYGRFDFAIHGRYLFSVLPIIYLVWNQLIINRLKHPLLKVSYVGLSILIFFITCFPYFIHGSSSSWYKGGHKVWLNEK